MGATEAAGSQVGDLLPFGQGVPSQGVNSIVVVVVIVVALVVYVKSSQVGDLLPFGQGKPSQGVNSISVKTVRIPPRWWLPGNRGNPPG